MKLVVFILFFLLAVFIVANHSTLYPMLFTGKLYILVCLGFLSAAFFLYYLNKKIQNHRNIISKNVPYSTIMLFSIAVATGFIGFIISSSPEAYPVQDDWVCLKKLMVACGASPYQRFQVPMNYPDAADMIENHFDKFGPWEEKERMSKKEMVEKTKNVFSNLLERWEGKESDEFIMIKAWEFAGAYPYWGEEDFNTDNDYIKIERFRWEDGYKYFLNARISDVDERQCIVELWEIKRLND